MGLSWNSKDKEKETSPKDGVKPDKKQKKIKEDNKILASKEIVTDVDFIVGIDFGQTYTGKALALPTDQSLT